MKSPPIFQQHIETCFENTLFHHQQRVNTPRVLSQVLIFFCIILNSAMAFSTADPSSSLSSRYYQRLHLDPAKLDSSPTLKKLATIVEAQLDHIPFENLSQHGAGRAACLDIPATAAKILDAKRGGFCYEVNSLLSEWLASEDLGYNVERVPAIVHSKERGYDKPPSHICMIVTIDNDDGEPTPYFVDVGFGEPSIHPLKLEFDTEQKTVEGMVSRFVRNDDGVIGLEWLSSETGKFEPRVQFCWQQDEDSSTKKNTWSLSNFAKDFEEPYKEASPFVKKIVCCRVTRTHKYTVAGNRLKVTTPRFGPESQQTVQEIASTDEGRSILLEKFGIPLVETEGLDFENSKTADSALWMTF